MRKQFSFLTALFLCLAPAHGAPLAERLQHLPQPVRKTVREQLGDDGKLGRVARTTDDGQTVFEVTINKDGKSRDFTIARDGSVLDKEVFLDEVPKEVQKTILQTAHGATVDDITQTTDDGEVNYDVEVIKDGVSRDFTVGAGGQLLSLEMPLAETPPAVQKTIREKTQGATAVDIYKTTEDGEDTYNVEMTKDGQEQDFDVAADGEYLGTDIPLNDAPDAVRKTILAEAASGKIGDITQNSDEDGAFYEADITDGTGTRYVTVNADGAIDSIERPIDLSDAPAAVQLAVKDQGGTVVDISKFTEDGEVTYEIEIMKAGTKQELTLKPDGKPSEP
jgi:uncharacterized membrane protein YkoI